MKDYPFIIPLTFGFLLQFFTSILPQTGWRALNSGTNNNLRAIYPLNYQTIFVAGDGARVLASNDSGMSWQDISPTVSPVNLNDIVFFDSLSGLVVGDFGTLYRTTDGGTNWSTVTSGISDNLLSVSFADSNGICGARSQSIIISSNLGETWTVVQSGFLGGGFWGTYMLSPDLGFLLGENSIFQPLLGRTVDGGANWNYVPFYINNNEGRGYDIIFTDIQRGYAACRVWDGRGAISRTTDGGANWNSTFFNSPLYGIDFPVSNTSLVGYAVGEAGTILKTTDAGNSWHLQNSNTPNALNDIAFIDFDYGFAVGNNGTILKTETGGDPPVHMASPNQFVSYRVELMDNFPNPFNSTTTIRWQLPVNSFVRLEIYNPRGQIVATLVHQMLSAGSHSVKFDASALASGIYIYRLEAGVHTKMKKMILLK